jgi:2-oxo-hept-3-ene-1,7-dioate hydratase
MTPAQINAAADTLFHAEQARRQRGLISVEHPMATMDDAYAIQAAFVARKQAFGDAQIGWKIGLTSRAMQMALNIDIPDSGVLLQSMAFTDGVTIPANHFIQPRIEAEIAFVMRAAIAGDVTTPQVLAATDCVCPALEILDTRILRADAATGKARTVVDTISDNAANAGIVLGTQMHRPTTHDLRRVGAVVTRDGVVEETGLGAGVLGDPVLGIVWLARRLAQFGQRIEAGQVILSGSFIRPIECTAGCDIHADFGTFGNVSLRFA